MKSLPKQTKTGNQRDSMVSRNNMNILNTNRPKDIHTQTKIHITLCGGKSIEHINHLKLLENFKKLAEFKHNHVYRYHKCHVEELSRLYEIMINDDSEIKIIQMNSGELGGSKDSWLDEYLNPMLKCSRMAFLVSPDINPRPQLKGNIIYVTQDSLMSAVIRYLGLNCHSESSQP